MRTEEQYQQSLLSLLPKGKFWNRSLTSTLANFWLGVAAEFVRIEGRMRDLFYESLIKQTSELLTEHEDDYGIAGTGSNDARRKVLLAKKLSVGANDEAYFIEKADALGFNISIDIDNPAWVGILRVGDPIAGQEVIYKWIVYVDMSGNKGAFGPGFNPKEFNSLWINDTSYYYTHAAPNIETMIAEFTKFKPAHTRPYYVFSGVGFSNAFGFGFDAVPWYDGTSPPGSFSREFGDGFHNLRDYDGVILNGAYNACFGVGFDRFSGGAFDNEFAIDFNKPS